MNLEQYPSSELIPIAHYIQYYYERWNGSIEYVILQELIQLVQPNHSKKFHDLLGALMPNHEERKKVLDKKIIRDLQ